MSNQVELSPEIARLAQLRVRATGTPLSLELARTVAEEAIIGLDEEKGILIDSAAAFSQDRALVEALGINDVVVNGSHIDVRPLDEDGTVKMEAALVGTSYLEQGTLVVRLSDSCRGEVVAFVPGRLWQAAAVQGRLAVLTVEPVADFDLERCLTGLLAEASLESKGAPPASPDAAELARFIADRGAIGRDRQREIVEILLSSPQTRGKLNEVARLWSDGSILRILAVSGAWSGRVERLVDQIAPRFALHPRDEVRKIVMRAGELYGGQPESPAFQKQLLSSLAQAEIRRRFKGADLARLGKVVEVVMGGCSVTDAVKDFVRNNLAVDIALAIKEGRQKATGFMAATAEEIGMAFQQLALRPVYATHSCDAGSGVEPINDALALLEAGDLALSLKELEAELESGAWR